MLALLPGLVFSCQNRKEQPSVQEMNMDSVETIVPFPELEEGEIFLKNKNPFGEMIELSGKYITGDTAIFKTSETEMHVKGNRLIMKNRGNPPFRIFSLPDLREIRTAGISGRGPDEFISSTLIPSGDTTFLCYVFENTNHKLYKLQKNGTLEYCRYPFEEKKKRAMFGSERELSNVSENDFLYVDNSPTGKSIYRIALQGDSVITDEVFNLALNPNRKSPFAYIGSFAVNAKKNRMAYAYKYFKIIKFMDLDAGTVRTINFERNNFYDNTLYKVDGLDQNITHYWKVCAQDEYVYFLYSGRTPYDVAKENQKQNYYIYVEQYDWNGDPIQNFKLDQWGYFTVDEKNHKLYLASTSYDDPFFEYTLP